MATEKRLIDEFKSEIMSKFIELCRGNDYNKLTLLRIGDTIDRIYEKYRTLPTVDAVEVVHGRWENFGEHRKMDLRCSVCNNRASKFVGGTEDWWDMWKPAYCPNCGAKMDGGMKANEQDSL